MGASLARQAGKKPEAEELWGVLGIREGGQTAIRRYIYRPLDASASFFCMPKAAAAKPAAAKPAAAPAVPTARLPHYAALAQSLAGTGWISEGYVQDRGPGAGGPHYQWTRKVKGKTVSVALSREQYDWLKAAIANWRRLQAILKEMQRLSRAALFASIPGPVRRKRLSKKVLGIN